MQTSQHGGDGRSAVAPHLQAARFLEDTERVTLKATGWHSAIGSCFIFSTTPRAVLVPRGEHAVVAIPWTRIDVPVFYPSHVSTLLLLQGALLQSLFPPTAFFVAGRTPFLRGPFALVHGKASSFAAAPFCIRRLVLAQLTPEEFQVDVLSAIASELATEG